MNLLSFNVEACRTQEELEDAISKVLECPMNNYFIAYSYWNKSCEHLIKQFDGAMFDPNLKRTLYLINVFDIPYYMTLFKDNIVEKNINGSHLLNYANVPQMIVLNKQSVRLVNNNSGIYEELGL